MRITFIFISLIAPLLFICGTCEKDTSESCPEVRAIATGCCSSTTMFLVPASMVTGDTVEYNGVTYYNVIRVAGLFSKGPYCGDLRPFDNQVDKLKNLRTCECVQAMPWEHSPLYIFTPRDGQTP